MKRTARKKKWNAERIERKINIGRYLERTSKKTNGRRNTFKKEKLKGKNSEKDKIKRNAEKCNNRRNKCRKNLEKDKAKKKYGKKWKKKKITRKPEETGRTIKERCGMQCLKNMKKIMNEICRRKYGRNKIKEHHNLQQQQIGEEKPDKINKLLGENR